MIVAHQHSLVRILQAGRFGVALFLMMVIHRVVVTIMVRQVLAVVMIAVLVVIAQTALATVQIVHLQADQAVIN